MDLDETVLDNSPIQAYYAINGKSYPEGWHEWVMYAKAEVVYGAKEFLDFAHKNGVGIYYVTDRNAETEFEATKKKSFGKRTSSTIRCKLDVKSQRRKRQGRKT